MQAEPNLGNAVSPLTNALGARLSLKSGSYMRTLYHLPFAEDSFQTACKNSSGQYAYSSPENIHMVCIITIITPSNSKSSMNTNPCVNVVTVGQMGCEDIPSDSWEKGVLQLFKCL